MTDAMRKRFAELEGLIGIHKSNGELLYQTKYIGCDNLPHLAHVPHYDTDADLDRVVRLLDKDQLTEYVNNLCYILHDKIRHTNAIEECVKATVDKKQAALIAAMGWREE